MAAKTMTSLPETLDRLAAFEPTSYPVITLYLNTQPDQHGRDNFDGFLRKELTDRLQSYPAETPERASLERDVERIREYLRGDLQASANGVAIFASDGAGLFEALQSTAPIDCHRLYVDQMPHLYPLARINDQYPRYAVLLVNTNSARLFVVGNAQVERTEEVTGTKTRRAQMGGWSQARYQRHVENYHLHHVKEVIEVLDRVAREEGITQLVISGEEVAMPLVREQLPPHLEKIVIDILHLDMATPQHEVLRQTLAAVRQKDAVTDAEKVEAAVGAWRARGLGTVGVAGVRAALEMGQVDELLISAHADVDAPAAGGGAALTENVAEELVTHARQTSARITFIEDAGLLARVGGVAALLRFRIDETPARQPFAGETGSDRTVTTGAGRH